MARDRLIGVTMGDPAGIGSEIIVKAYPHLVDLTTIVVIGDRSVMEAAIDSCESPLSVTAIETIDDVRRDPHAIPVLDLDQVDELEYGVVRADYGAASLAYVERAIELAQAGAIDAITTAPINKQATRLAGSEHAGHTGLLAARTETDTYTMLLIHDDLRVTHVSTHVPLREACDLVTTENVLSTISVTHDGLQELGLESPQLAVAGVNPHASDGGLLGSAEATEIEPAISQAQAGGIDVVGPEPPDTVFAAAAGGPIDCVVSMYHDQGHIPIKMLGFDDAGITGVNMTLGLPIIRTSVDHGTAFDIAGQGIADPGSLIDAVEVAVQAVRSSS